MKKRILCVALGMIFVILIGACSTSSDPQGVVDSCLKAYASGNNSAALAYIQANQYDTVFRDLKNIASSKSWTFSNKTVGPAKATIEVHSSAQKVLVELMKVNNSWLIITDSNL